MSFVEQHSHLWVVIPVKDFVSAKQRLSGVLSPRERRALSQAMVEDMLQRLQLVSEVRGVLLVSDDPGAELLAYRYGARVITQSRENGGLNAAAAQAARWLHRVGASHMLLLHGDLPCLRAEDIADLVKGVVAKVPSVYLVPDCRGEGTNGLLCSLPAPIDFFYGAQSLTAHLQACRRRGVPVELVAVPSLALDVDTPADLHALTSIAGLGEKTARFLGDSQIPCRLRQMLRADERVVVSDTLPPDTLPPDALPRTGNNHAH
jgi:2-phospho-L-lactate guanylyltransferase